MTESTAPAPLSWTDLDRRVVDTVRVLAMDAVQRAGNGHPGTAMSLAPAAYLLFNRVMRHDPADPTWPAPDQPRPATAVSPIEFRVTHWIARRPSDCAPPIGPARRRAFE